MKIRTIRSLEELETIRAWWEGWQNHPNSDMDQFKIVCQLRQEILSPYVTVVEREGQPQFILVGRLEQTFFEPYIGYLKPIRIPAKVLILQYKGSLGEENDEIAGLIVQYLWSLLASGEADAIEFHHLAEDSPLLRRLLFHGPLLWCEKRPVWSNHWTMDIPEEPGSLLKKVRSKHRSWIRKKQRELETAFPSKISWIWMTDFYDIPSLCQRLETVAARTYQRGLGAGFFDIEEYRQRFALFARRGQLRVQLLEIEGDIKAFWFGEVYGGAFHSSATGYTPELLNYEPGTLLFIHMIDELAREGVRRFDFGLGDSFYKQRFGDQSWREGNVRLYAPTVKGFFLRSSFWFFGMLDAMGRNLVEKIGGLDRIKTGWRRRLTPSKREISAD